MSLKDDLMGFLPDYNESGFVGQGHTVEEVKRLRARLARAEVIEPPEPTDAELLNALRRELPENWNFANCTQPNEIMVSIQGRGVLAYVTYAALRKHGPKATADALRLLAGEGGA